MSDKDTIYRQDAIRAFDCSIGGVPVESVKYVFEYADKMMSRINALPPAQPERKRGMWNKYYRMHFKDTFCCNKCGVCFIVLQGSESMNFCPNCGADMRDKEGAQE